MQKVDAQQLRVRIRKASGDIPQKPAKIIRTELQSKSLISIIHSNGKGGITPEFQIASRFLTVQP